MNCPTGKKKYSHAAAKREQKWMKGKQYAGAKLVVYECDKCHWWHIGNME